MHRRTQFRAAGRWAQSGTSLIEILVVLVILVVGILSIVRLFPAGFIALRNAENATFADRLAEGALQSLKKDNASLPDAVYMYSTADGFNPNFPSNTASDFDKTYTPTGANGPDAAFNDINKQRYISNETITVPAGRVVSGNAYPPLHVLNYGPIYLPPFMGANMTLPAVSLRYLPVSSMPWGARTGDSRVVDAVAGRAIDNPPDILQPGQQAFLVDPTAGRIAVPTATYPQTFTVVIRGASPATPVTLTIQMPASNAASSPYLGDWFDPTNSQYLQPDPATGVTPTGAALPTAPWTTVTLARPFQYMGIYGGSAATYKAFDADPYEYAVYNSTAGGSAVGANSSMGVLAFNPLASGQNGTMPLKARISYQVLDWHILHEDHDVSAGTPTIRLTLNHLKKIGDVQFDQSTFGGLIGDATTKADLMMLDLDTGQLTNLAAPAAGAAGGNTYNDDDNSGNGSTTTPATSQYVVSYQNGRVSFPNQTEPLHLRFFYAGDAEWAVAVTKAPSTYVRSLDTTGKDDPGPLSQTTTQKAPGVTPTPNLYAVSGARVYFPLCDAGKTVEFDGIAYTPANGTAATVAEATGTISTANELVGGSKLVYVNLSDIATGIDTTKPVTFQAVRGVSARATVIWHERNHWRTRSVDTLLTQTQ